MAFYLALLLLLLQMTLSHRSPMTFSAQPYSPLLFITLSNILT